MGERTIKLTTNMTVPAASYLVWIVEHLKLAVSIRLVMVPLPVLAITRCWWLVKLVGAFGVRLWMI